MQTHGLHLDTHGLLCVAMRYDSLWVCESLAIINVHMHIQNIMQRVSEGQDDTRYSGGIFS